ncbi:MAG: TolB family protein, partial [bacterium]
MRFRFFYLLVLFTVLSLSQNLLAKTFSPSQGTANPAAQNNSKEQKWDVTAALGPSKTLEFTTTEGTWMNLDVSPDGQKIVFDLLGDIYILPITGGEAKLLAGGPAFEVQPRFSPDGKKISYTSDRGGGDNIWVMNRDGSEAQAVTNEDFRLLNNACWTPDG